MDAQHYYQLWQEARSMADLFGARILVAIEWEDDFSRYVRLYRKVCARSHRRYDRYVAASR